MKIFVTNLKGFDERKNWMISQLNKLGLTFEFIDCIDGRGWSEEHIESITSPELFKLHLEHKQWLTKGAIAATQTHRDLIHKKIIDEQTPYALCLEDDTILNKDFVADLKEVESIISENNLEGVILLHHILRQKTSLSELKALRKNKTVMYKLPENFLIGSGAAYIVTLEAAGKIYHSQIPISRIGDSWHEHPNVPIYFVYPELVQTGMFASTLGYSKNNLHKLVSFFVPRFMKQKIRVRNSTRLTKENIEP